MTSPQAVLHVYHSATKSMQMVTPRGKLITFISGKHYTDDEEVIQFLNEVVTQKRGVSVNPAQLTIPAEERDPMTALRNKLRAELLAEMQEQLNPNKDGGTTVQGPLNATSTRDIAAVAAGGNATQLQDQVSKLMAGSKSK